MLKRIHIKNCLSFEDFKIDLERINVIVGRNNSGKTNFCRVLQFLKLSQETDLNDAFRRSMGYTARFLNFGSERSYAEFSMECELPGASGRNRKSAFNYSLKVRCDGCDVIKAKPILTVENETLKVKRAGSDEITLIKNVRGKTTLMREKTTKKTKKWASIEEKIKPEKTMLSELVDSDEYEMSNQFKKYLRLIANFDIEPRYLKSIEIDRRMMLDGRGNNLWWSVYVLKNERKDFYRDYLTLVQMIEPGIVEIEIDDEKIRHQAYADPAFSGRDDHHFELDSVSGGTLRFMGLAMILIMSEMYFKELKISPTFTIEEPENGIHAGMLKLLYNLFKESPGQIIFTSHSPFMIDLFDDNIDGLKVLENQNGRTAPVRVDKRKIKKLLEKMPLGDMHFYGVFTP
ncbi:MAG: AAA family ATPase [bacterium]